MKTESAQTGVRPPQFEVGHAAKPASELGSLPIGVSIADDLRLVEMAKGRACELFPIFDRAGALTPLVALLAVLPGLFSLYHRTLDDEAALWGLRSLDLLSARGVNEWVDFGGTASAAAMKWQPPLGSWLTALVMELVGTERAISLVLVSYLSTAGLLGMLFVLCRRLLGARVAVWTVLLAAFEGRVLEQARDPAPQALALLLVVTAFWAFFHHLDRASGAVSLKLLPGGIALGLCLLAGGPLAVVAVAVLLIFAVTLRGASLGNDRVAGSEALRRPGEAGAGPSLRSDTASGLRRRVWIGSTALKAAGVIALTGFAVGGWWVLMMSSRYGWSFWMGWLSGSIPAGNERSMQAVVETAADLAVEGTGRLVGVLGLLSGLWVFGVWRACRRVWGDADEAKRHRLQFLLAWTACALFAWMSSRDQGIFATHLTELWEEFFLLSGLMLIGFAIDEIAQRRAGVPVVAGVVAATLAAVYWQLRLAGGDPADAFLPPWIAGWSAGLLVVAWWSLRRFGASRDMRQRLALGVLVLAPIGAHVAEGFHAARYAAENAANFEDDRALSLLRKQLAAIGPAEACLLITGREPPHRLHFLLRSQWRAAAFSVHESWSAAHSVIAAMQTASESPPGGDKQPLVLVEWAARDSRRTNIEGRGVDIRPISPWEYFLDEPLRVFVVTPRVD